MSSYLIGLSGMIPIFISILKTRRVFVGGVPQHVTKKEFQAYFTQFGEIIHADLVIDRQSQNHRGLLKNLTKI
jgi:RNA recognition motif-containing protein